MMLRVATFAMNERMLGASMKTQAKMAEMQLQQASGLISTDYSGIASSARTLINLEISMQRSETYQKSASEVDFRVQTMSKQTDIMADLLANFRTQIIAMRSTDRTTDTSQTLIDAAEANLLQMSNLLNSTYGGRYLFGGSVTTTPPVDVTGLYDAMDPFGGPNTDYYGGDDTKAQVQVSTDHTVEYGVTANATPFEQALRAIRMISTASGNIDDSILKEAQDLATEALDGVTVIMSGLGVTSGILQSAVDSQKEYQFFVDVNITNIKAVDEAEVAVQLKTYQTQLQASYAALAQIQSISLNDYLK